ncbi:MAG: hypothetical protein WBM14_18210 [Terracidiphilus sp.]
MQQIQGDRVRPELKELVMEASRALARLDAERLEELAQSCQVLNRTIAPADAAECEVLAEEARAATQEMAVFARVLEATRANANVMNRLRELRAGRLEYGPRLGTQWALTETSHGDD